MSISLNTYLSLEVVIDNAQVVIGQRNVPVAQTLAGQKYDASFSITNTSGDDFNSDVVWATGDGGMDTFDTMWLITDAAALVEIQNDNSDTIVLPLVANIPLILSADDLDVAGLGADGSATTLAQVVNQITVKNNTTGASADVTVNGRIALFN